MGTDPATDIAQALRHYQTGDLVEAEAICGEILSQFAEEHRALHLWGQVLAQSGAVRAGLEKVQQAVDLAPETVDYLLTQAQLQWQLQDQAALAVARQVTLLDPGNGPGYLLSAQIFAAQQRWLKCFAQAQLAVTLSLDPEQKEQAQGIQSQVLTRLGDPDLKTIQDEIQKQTQRYWQQAQSSEQLGHPQQAFNHYTLAIYIQPDNAAIEDAIGKLLGSWGYPKQAIHHHQRALYFQPNVTAYQLNLGLDYQRLGDHDTAKLYFEQALKQDPTSIDAVTSLATLEDLMGESTQAIDRLTPFLPQNRPTPELAISYARISRTPEERERAIESLQICLSQPEHQGDPKRLWFALGYVQDKLGRYDLAFASYQQANGLFVPDPARQPFNPDEHIQWIDQILSIYTASDLQSYAKADQPSTLPLFIVGMPRSGTSLVEQILSTHPQVFGAGEREDINRIVKEISVQLSSSYPELASSINCKTLTFFSQKYLQAFKELDRKVIRISDKMPTNFRYLGLISQLFPHCRIIHCVRDPRDTCLSCYFHDFVAHPYSYDLRHLGIYYRQYQRLMHHWQQVLDIPILNVEYEKLITETEPTCRQIVEFCQLDWDPVCLSFYQSDRVTKTASSKQVKQPIYTTSMSRYRHYQAHLDPLLEALFDPV